MRINHTAVAATVLLALATGSVAGTRTASAQTASNPSRVSLFAQQERLAALFRWSVGPAVSPTATRADRAHFVSFLKVKLLPYLVREASTVYPLVDSLAGTGGYATWAASLDAEGIERLVDRLASSVGSGDPNVFVAHAYALSAALESHFTKDLVLIQPIVDRLGWYDIQTLIAEGGH